jgi:transcription-repair coupling factor (superfamily II helicase)
VHVLTLSATPIPRTLQLAMTGVRELSLITTPPVDRMAVRTFISPFDPCHRARNADARALSRRAELLCLSAAGRSRGGGSVPAFGRAGAEVRHRPWPDGAGELDDIMNAFYDGQYDVLLSTTIVESGLDVPTANTLIVHRADMFGLAQLYQLRGRSAAPRCAPSRCSRCRSTRR